MTTTPDPYTSLRTMLDLAYAQASIGKGKDRHANDLPCNRPVVTACLMAG